VLARGAGFGVPDSRLHRAFGHAITHVQHMDLFYNMTTR
jgi:hypothetical protein